jgi:hypothetical protein
MVAPGQQKQGPPGYCQPGWFVFDLLFVFESLVFLRIAATAFESLVCVRFIAVTGLFLSHWFVFELLPAWMACLRVMSKVAAGGLNP